MKAAYENKANELIDIWLANIKDVIRHHKTKLNSILDENEKLNRPVESNVLELIEKIKPTSISTQALHQGQN